MLEMNTKNADFHFFKRQITSFGFPADVQTLSAGNLNELTGILRGNPRVMSVREEFKRL